MRSLSDIHEDFKSILSAWETASLKDEYPVQQMLLQKIEQLISSLLLLPDFMSQMILLGTLWEISLDMAYLSNNPCDIKRYDEFRVLGEVELWARRLQTSYLIRHHSEASLEFWLEHDEEIEQFRQNLKALWDDFLHFDISEIREESNKLFEGNIILLDNLQIFKSLIIKIKNTRGRNWRDKIKAINERSNYIKGIEQLLLNDPLLDIQSNYLVSFDDFIYAHRNAATHAAPTYFPKIQFMHFKTGEMATQDTWLEFFLDMAPIELIRYSLRKLRSNKLTV